MNDDAKCTEVGCMTPAQVVQCAEGSNYRVLDRGDHGGRGRQRGRLRVLRRRRQEGALQSAEARRARTAGQPRRCPQLADLDPPHDLSARAAGHLPQRGRSGETWSWLEAHGDDVVSRGGGLALLHRLRALWQRKDPPAWSPLSKPLSESTLALVCSNAYMTEAGHRVGPGEHESRFRTIPTEAQRDEPTAHSALGWTSRAGRTNGSSPCSTARASWSSPGASAG